MQLVIINWDKKGWVLRIYLKMVHLKESGKHLHTCFIVQKSLKQFKNVQEFQSMKRAKGVPGHLLSVITSISRIFIL